MAASPATILLTTTDSRRLDEEELEPLPQALPGYDAPRPPTEEEATLLAGLPTGQLLTRTVSGSAEEEKEEAWAVVLVDTYEVGILLVVSLSLRVMLLLLPLLVLADEVLSSTGGSEWC